MKTGYFEALELEFGMNKFANLHRSAQINLMLLSGPGLFLLLFAFLRALNS